MMRRCIKLCGDIFKEDIIFSSLKSILMHIASDLWVTPIHEHAISVKSVLLKTSD